MELYDFKAFAFQGELDLNRLAAGMGIARKYRWEEPMLLSPGNLTPLSAERSESSQVCLYFFGGKVFINCGENDIRCFFKRMERHSADFGNLRNARCSEQYSLTIKPGTEYAITDNSAIMPCYVPVFIDIICFVIAKSVALERIEEKIGPVLDEMEDFITLLGKGKLRIPDRKFALLASRILDFKYRSLAHVMVLDKPDVTLDNPKADRLYLTMANLFELNQRYAEIRHKSETLLDMTGVFSSLSHASRAAQLELVIIILIFIEIVIYVVQTV